MKAQNSPKKNGLAFSYIRCSSPEQIKGDTKRRQLEAAEKYARESGLILSEQGYADLGISAYRGKNTEEGSDLNALIAAIKDGRIPKGSTLIIENLDRLSRDYITNSLPVFMSLIQAGVIVVTLMDRKEYTLESIQKNPFDLMYSIMVLARGHEESAAKSERIGEAWKNAQANADKKKIAQNYPGWLDLKDNKFSILQDRAAVIRDIFKQFLDGKGTNAIARDLNARGIATFTGKTWFQTTVKFYLRFAAVIGEYHAGRREKGKKVLTGQVVPDYYPAVISKDDYYRAQARMKLNPPKMGRPQPEDANLFNGLVVCGYCGGSMGIYNAKASNSYICWNGVSGGCLRIAYPVENVEVGILSRLHHIAQDWNARLVDHAQLERHEGELAELDGKISKLVQLAESGLELTEVTNRLKVLQQARLKIIDTIADVKSIQGVATKSIFQQWYLDTLEGDTSKRLAMKPHIRKHIKCVRIFPAGNKADEYRTLLKEYAKKKVNGSQCFQAIRKKLKIHRIAYYDVELMAPVRLDGKLSSVLPLGHPDKNVQLMNDGFQIFPSLGPGAFGPEHLKSQPK